MKPLYSDQEYLNANSTDKLPCECYYCKSTFLVCKKQITSELKKPRNKVKFCSQECLNNTKRTKQTVVCKNCNTVFLKKPSKINKNNFCSKSCSVSYNNTHKTYGTRRSKLEIWIQDQLTKMYPNTEIHYNQKTAINSELDIYIPSLNLAFELNGIFHYEPIYGIDKLNQIKINDISKTKACHDQKIDLCIIDTSTQTYVKPKTSQKFLDIIINIVNERL